MAKTKGHAGRNIRRLAFSRRFKAVYSFISAAFVIYLPFLLVKLTKTLHELTNISDSDATNQFTVPLAFYLLTVVISLSLLANGVFLWKRANHADQGAKGEEDIAKVLHSLADNGWQIEYGKRFGKRSGDVDIICISPNKKTYVIDVKSHRGNIYTDGKTLYRHLGKQKYSFKKDFLAQVTKQALKIKKETGANFVTPIVAFSDAQVSIASGKIKHVHVTDKNRLVTLLRSLG